MIRPDLESLPAYVPGARNERAIKLSSNECAEEPLPSVQEAMSRALATMNRYPDMGAVELRAALARHLGVDEAQVAVGTGSSALCQQLVTAAAGPGDEVVFPWRSFEAYPIFAQIAGATPVAVPLTADHRVDLPALAAAVTQDTKLVFVCNPNNPTSTTVTDAEFAAFMASVPEDVLVALDEAYFEYNRAADTPVATDVITRYPNVVGLRTFSKAYGLAGARVGYAFGPRAIIEALNKVAVPFSVSSVAQVAALASLDAQDELHARVDATVAERSRVVEKLGLSESQANFVWLPREGQDLADRLAAEGVLVRVFPEGIRVTVTNAEETDALLEAWDRAQ
ncbi:histidinol-phosphate transaminase [Corynebacterium sp. zg912]|uniref:Aromatic amino acid aminotransferase n=1 Tax=Corynebacterium wankanglinii TaxID=2735136 RepID=A0A7H0KBQ5_9CORY|nr:MULTISPECIES: histidinol-phosphate transaminase [Corynebacterium]MBA1837472.1 histidinol-phosphate transaminase [Corynebacterium wankanglinii]MCR5928692.1 histidinol-phosphate transaminase [Corynebacterium sp. zg912]QNP94721.1 histidinol-phosphate transaminase [Corynebacterium wankanglinii]